MAEIIEFKRPERSLAGANVDDEQAALMAIETGLTLAAKGRLGLQLLRSRRGNPELELPPKTHPDPEDRARARQDMLACPAPPPGVPISQSVRSVMRHRWHVQWARVQAAKHWERAADLDSEWHDSRPDAAERDAQWKQASAAYHEECLILMMVPAWSKEALAWKHKHTEDLAEDRDQWGPVLAADEARLIARGKAGGSAPRLVTEAS